MNIMQCLWIQLSIILLKLDAAMSQTSVFLQFIGPVTERQACPGEDIMLFCRVSSVPHQSMPVPPSMYWLLFGFSNLIMYYNGAPLSAHFGNFYTTALFSDDNYIIASNATLKSATFINNGMTVTCRSPLSSKKKVILVAGAENSPTGLGINVTNTTTVVLTWLPPNGSDYCVFNYTVTISNSCCNNMTVNSSNTSLILTDLLIYPGHYSFAVAVIDSAGQHGPWSDHVVLYVAPEDKADISMDELSSGTTSQYHISHAVQSSLNSALIVKSSDHFKISMVPTVNATDINEEPNFIVFFVVLSLTSGALVICTASLAIAVCMFWYSRRHKTASPDNIVVYDLPIFNTNGRQDKMCIQQNTAYESVAVVN